MQPQTLATYQIQWHGAMADIDAAAWDRLAIPLTTPLMEWQWLHQLEDSGSIAPPTGWIPCHLTVWRDRRLVAAAPLYVKTHSAGEFVFDQVWAEVAQRLGSTYYPKLVGMSPLTPVVGYRFLMDPGEDPNVLTRLMVGQIDERCRDLKLNSVSFLFVDPQWGQMVQPLGFIAWLHQSYAWHNPGLKSLDAYLKLFKSNQRRNIHRERKSLADNGIRFQAFAGDQIPRYLVPLMYRFYADTNARYGPWGCKYLNRRFFEGIFRHYAHRLLLMAGVQDGGSGDPLALSMLLKKGDGLIGRYWGAAVQMPNLHFNACFYAPIEWAISHGIRYFDPGAGSPHKIRRGFKAVGNHSLHRYYNRNLDLIVRSNMAAINRAEQAAIDQLNHRLPFSEAVRRELFGQH